jgi:hypothetical protein
MNRQVERAIRETLEAWDAADSPEALAAAIYQLKRVYKTETTKKLPRRKPNPPAPSKR